MTCHQVAAENLIERYVQGTLDPALRDDFENHYFACESCLAALQTVQRIKPVLATQQPPVIGKRPLLPWIGLAAAAAVIFAVMTWPRLTLAPVTAFPPVARVQDPAAPVMLLLAEVQPAPYAPTLFRDGSSGAQPDFQQAMKLYQSRQWKEAAQALAAVARRPPTDPAALHFAGISHLLANQTESALAALDRVIAMGPKSPFEEEARFFRAQALLLSDRRPEARQELERIIQRRGDYDAAARSLLNRF